VLRNSSRSNAAISIKYSSRHYGGNAFYRRSLPFFVGLILGDLLTQAT
jgi:hypothetical protein